MAAQKKDDTAKRTDQMVKVFLATALVALPLGYLVGNAAADTDDADSAETSQVEDDHAHGESDAHSDSGASAHEHGQLEVAAEDAPAIDSIEVTKDPKSGWNLHMHTSNFTFAPESASGDHVDGQGHAHIYVDGKKITRLYGEDYYLGELAEGEHVVRVTLNTNDHKDYAVNGEVVEASATIVDMHHSTEDGHSDDDGHSHN